ncbi:MAG: hypothetical protein AOA65_1338 [Candidatus Bathyarchaeota archaeon BA1]|nr:MAG: hypothetical protein AOA65_1338 [Candidatus Bathyarchaeota archaeon BA1]
MRRREFFSIIKQARIYDRETGKFVIDIIYKTAAPELTPRTIAVAEGFGLGIDEGQTFPIYENAQFKISPTDIVLITGDSGSGKSVLLKVFEKDIKQDMGLSCVNIADIQPELSKPLIETIGEILGEGLELLSKVGLNDAFLFLRTYV